MRIDLAADQPRPAAVTWQGRADAGLCYPPQTIEFSADQPLAATDTKAGLAEDQSIARQLADAGLLINLLAFFVMGLLLAFTPACCPCCRF